MVVNEEKQLPFLTHLAELRHRILKSLLAVLIFFVPGYHFKNETFDLLMKPIRDSLPEGSSLIFTKPAEGFTTFLKVSFFAAVILAIPVILYQLWKFIAPALYRNEQRILIPLVAFGTIFFFIGALFCYFVAAPAAFRFLLGEYTTDYVKALPNISDALSFLMSMMIGFGIVFEFPVASFVLARIGLIDAKLLRSKRKYAILISALAAAIITPTTDALSMMFMLVPIVIFYEIGIVVAWIFEKKRDEEQIE